jgi:sulfonate transport system substrate-binding protein
MQFSRQSAEADMRIHSFHRRLLLSLTAMALVLSAGNVAAGNTAVGNAVQTGSRTASLPKEIRIGFQKSSVNLTLLKHRRALEQQLKGVKISWFEFTGPADAGSLVGRQHRLCNDR